MANVAGPVIALTLMFVIIFGLPLTEVSVSPVHSTNADLWALIIGPLVGAVLAFVVCRGSIKE